MDTLFGPKYRSRMAPVSHVLRLGQCPSGFRFAASFLLLVFAIGAAPVDFQRDVAPILARHCVSCHRPGEVAPFPLTTQDEAASHARTIAQAARMRRMPPWKPQPLSSGIAFENERRLTPAEISVLEQWGRQPVPGPGRIPLPPAAPWILGTPDLVLEMPAPFDVAATASDVYQCFVIPLPPATSGRWVRAFEFQPGNRRLVHHALVFTDTSGAARSRLSTASPDTGYPCFGIPGFLPRSALGGWSPGNRAVSMSPGTAVFWPGQGDLVFQIHYHSSGKPEADRSRLGIYFSASAPTRRLIDIPLASRRIDIPPGERRYRVRDHFTVPVDVEIESVIPHAHYLARRMTGRALLPDRRRLDLLRIDDWDFNWQEIYRYRTPIHLPAGTRLEMDFEYDNSAANPRNPSRPPRRVTWGPETTDEMAGLHFAASPTRPSDWSELTQALWGKMIRFLRDSSSSSILEN